MPSVYILALKPIAAGPEKCKCHATAVSGAVGAFPMPERARARDEYATVPALPCDVARSAALGARDEPIGRYVGWSLSSRRSTLPDADFGIASMKSTRRILLYGATRSATKRISSSALTVLVATTNARGISPHSSSRPRSRRPTGTRSSRPRRRRNGSSHRAAACSRRGCGASASRLSAARSYRFKARRRVSRRRLRAVRRKPTPFARRDT